VLIAKASGCTVSGGLEVASDRLLKLIDKGVTVEQVARVTRNFRSRVMVHCYLMYGYPTQTVQETVDSLEMCVNCLKQEYCSLAFGINLHDGAQSCWNTSREIWC
jgi:radical SAM superfamily enzyme